MNTKEKNKLEQIRSTTTDITDRIAFGDFSFQNINLFDHFFMNFTSSK